jgi:hypothetical protein
MIVEDEHGPFYSCNIPTCDSNIGAGKGLERAAGTGLCMLDIVCVYCVMLGR